MMGIGFMYRENESEVEILRCYDCGDGFGERGIVVLPESICGKPVTGIGDYIFSEEMREQPDGDWWWEDIETDEAEVGLREPAEGRSPGEEERSAVCGEGVRELYLPSTLQRIGKYAFYNCDCLRRLYMTSTVGEIGAGAFNGCRKITDLHIDVAAGRKSCLKEILSELNETLTIYYREVSLSRDGRREVHGEAKLLFPLFYEEAVENTPARILETHVHGCGHRYRYCFEGTEFKFREYDSLFIHAVAQEKPEQAANLAMGRLRYPYQLSLTAEKEYADYLLAHMEETAACLLREDGLDGWRWIIDYFTIPDNKEIKNEHATAKCLGNEGLAARAREEYYDIKKPVLGETGFDKLIEAANRAGHTEVTSFLMDKRYQACPPKRKRFTL